MANPSWMELSIPLKGKLVMVFDHDPDTPVPVASFEYRVPVKFTMPGESADGIPTVNFDIEWLKGFRP